MESRGDTVPEAIIKGFKNRVLSPMKWVSASGLIGLLGVVGFVLALKKDAKLGNLSGLLRLSEKEDRLEKLCLVPGLQNLGNNCFLNVILQALASCRYFQPFLQKVIEECEEVDENLPLTDALAALLEELCLVGERRVVLSPRRVMRALEPYIQNFNLTTQQDAEEAFLHLMSSLRQEFSEPYTPGEISLVEAFAAPNCRILSPKMREGHSEHERWQKHFFGPLDGILSSILACGSCSSQISLDYQFFNSLPLSPVLNSGSTIMSGSTLEDCLKQFLNAEQVENYHCSHCWHIAAIKYLSLTVENEMEIEELRRCSVQDPCECRSRFHLETLPWSNNFSHTIKQLNISRCPKILCIHLQRASVNVFGELVKLRGHIAFPLILDLFPFMNTGVGIKDSEESWHRARAKLQHQRHSSSTSHINMKYHTKMLNSIYGLVGEDMHTNVLVLDELGCTAHVKTFWGESILPQTQSQSDAIRVDILKQADEKVNESSLLHPSETYFYRLVSVVEHYGRVGSGHYSVYRSVMTESHNENPGEQLEMPTRWFCISDSEVYGVSQKDVLAAEASLLFYEKLTES